MSDIFLCVDKKGRETIHDGKPDFDGCEWSAYVEECHESQRFEICKTIPLPEGTICKILGKEITFNESPVKLE